MFLVDVHVFDPTIFVWERFLNLKKFLDFLLSVISSCFCVFNGIRGAKESALRSTELCYVTIGRDRERKHTNSAVDLWNVSENFGEEIHNTRRLNSVKNKLKGCFDVFLRISYP